MKIIPAIDLLEGKAVRLLKGDFESRTIYSIDPIETAIEIENQGAKYLHLVDLNGSRDGKPFHLGILESICLATNLQVDYSGGILLEEDFKKVFDLGASKIFIGSLAIKNKKLLVKMLEKYGSEKISLSCDFLGDTISINGWKTGTQIKVDDYINDYIKEGFKEFAITDIKKDGTMKGPSLGTYKDILSKFDIQLIASGGISNYEDLKELEKINCYGAIIGKAYYEGKIKLEQIIKC